MAEWLWRGVTMSQLTEESARMYVLFLCKHVCVCVCVCVFMSTVCMLNRVEVMARRATRRK